MCDFIHGTVKGTPHAWGNRASVAQWSYILRILTGLKIVLIDWKLSN